MWRLYNLKCLRLRFERKPRPSETDSSSVGRFYCAGIVVPPRKPVTPTEYIASDCASCPRSYVCDSFRARILMSRNFSHFSQRSFIFRRLLAIKATSRDRSSYMHNAHLPYIRSLIFQVFRAANMYIYKKLRNAVCARLRAKKTSLEDRD